MKFGQVEIDAHAINALAALVTAIGGVILIIKGKAQRKRKDKDDE
jgi:hypothetical protein